MAAEDFTTIVVLHGRNSYEMYLEKGFEENYSGKYILALEDEIADKYIDINKYRYILNLNLRTNYGENITKSTSYRYMILDIKNNTV